uniref:Thioredoxin domain-containing protein n=1 Tax=Esox lucius TaxID=8010 RepID=A0AAY5KH60_ESOLU
SKIRRGSTRRWPRQGRSWWLWTSRPHGAVPVRALLPSSRSAPERVCHAGNPFSRLGCCGFLTSASPLFQSLSENHPDAVFLKVDVDDAPDVASSCDIKCMPTFHFYKNKQKVMTSTQLVDALGNTANDTDEHNTIRFYPGPQSI